MGRSVALLVEGLRAALGEDAARAGLRCLAVAAAVLSAAVSCSDREYPPWWNEVVEQGPTPPQSHGAAEVPAEERGAAEREKLVPYLRYFGYLGNGGPADFDSALREFTEEQGERLSSPFSQPLLESVHEAFLQTAEREWDKAASEDSPAAYAAFVERHEELGAPRLPDARRRLALAERAAIMEEAERRRHAVQAAEAARVEADRAQLARRKDLCYRELQSVVVDSTSDDLTTEDGVYYDHVYQYVEEYPYWSYVGGGLIGIEFKEKVWSGSKSLKGRLDAEGGNHASLRLSGRTTLDGMSIDIDMTDGVFGYLLFPKDLAWRERRGPMNDPPEGRFAGFEDIPKARVLTTVNGEVVDIGPANLNGDSNSFYDYEPPRIVARGTGRNTYRSGRDRWLGRRNYYWSNAETSYERPEEENLWLRTINVEGERTIEVAGRRRTQDSLCRYRFGPIAVTNDASLRPRIERELNAWANEYREMIEGEEILEFGKMPKRLDGDLRTTGRCGTVTAVFPRSLSAVKVVRWGSYLRPDVLFEVEAELRLNGRSMGVIAKAAIGSFRRQTEDDINESLQSWVKDRARNQDYRNVTWYGSADKAWRDCDWTPEGVPEDPNVCYLRAKRWVLQEFGCNP